MIEKTYPPHSRKHFFKYTSAATAIKILESSSVLYRSPIEFNDPFDVQSGLHFDFDVNSLPDKIFERIDKFVSLDTKPDVSESKPFGEFVMRLWKAKSTKGYPRDAIRDLGRPLLMFLTEEMKSFQQQYQNKWWNDFLPRLRVFSVSDTNDNLLMWAHYAKEHTGVVFEFRVLPEEDNPLCIAGPVKYSTLPPPFFTEEEWLSEMFDTGELDASGLFMRYAYVKSCVWDYEKEWRVWDLLESPEDKLHSNYPLKKNEIASVYFGCRTPPEMKATILRLMSSHATANAFQARKEIGQFRLAFDPL